MDDKPNRLLTRRKLLFGAGIAGAAAAAGVLLHDPKAFKDFIDNAKKKSIIRIGFEGQVYAIAPDIVVDGTDDHVQLQAALDALPASGGKIICYGGPYDFAATVSRAINNVIIEGSGKATYFANDGATDLISAGAQTGWILKDLRTDAGGLGGTWGTDNLRQNVWIDTTYYFDTNSAAADVSTTHDITTANDKAETQVLEISDAGSYGLAIYVDLSTLVTAVEGGTVTLKLYNKVDEANYREVSKAQFIIGSDTTHPSFEVNMLHHHTKMTIQCSNDVTATRSISYSYLTKDLD